MSAFRRTAYFTFAAALRRSAQYFFIRSDTAFRAAADIVRVRARVAGSLDRIFAFQSIPLVLRPPNDEVSHTARHPRVDEIVAQDLRTPTGCYHRASLEVSTGDMAAPQQPSAEETLASLLQR